MPVAKCCRVASFRPRAPMIAAVLQVALAPAPVARRDVDERGRALLVAAREVVQHVDRVAGAPHQRRLDEIVAEHVAAERRPAGKVGQPATGREGARADDGVVAPIVAVPARPHREAGRDHRAIDLGGELLRARKQRVAVDDQRQRLDDAGVGVLLHGEGKARDAFAGHQAVGVEHQHVIVGAAPARDEIGDVAGLAVMVLRPVAVMDAGVGAEVLAPGQEGALLGDPGVRIGRIRQHEIVEMLAEPGRLDLLAHRRERREGAGGRFVVDRHHDRGARAQRRGQRRQAPRSPQERDEAEEPAREGKRDPGEVHGEQEEQEPLQHGGAADRHDLVHLVGAVGRERRRPGEDEQSCEPGRAIRVGRRKRALLGARPARQRLHRHGERALGRHGGPRRKDRRRRRRCDLDRPQGVHRYSHVSLIGFPAASSRRRISQAFSLPGSSSKATRSVLRSG